MRYAISMNVRPEFQRFIGSTAWGRQKDFHTPTADQLQSNTFQVPVAEGLEGAIHRSHLDFLNIGHNVTDFNELDPDIKSFALEVADRRGTWGEIESRGDQGRLAVIHMSNVVHAQKSLLGTMLGPVGPALMDFMNALSENIPAAAGRLVSLGVVSGGRDMMTGDVYAVTPHEYAASTMNGISGEPIARVSVDLATGTAYRWPDEAFTGA